MPSWRAQDKAELLQHTVDLARVTITKGFYHEISKRMGGRFSPEGIRQQFIKMHKEYKGGSLKTEERVNPPKSSPAKGTSPVRGGGKRKRDASNLTPSPSPTGEKMKTLIRSLPPRKCPRKSYIESDIDGSVTESDTGKKPSKSKSKARMNGFSADMLDKIKYEDEEMEFEIDGVPS
ncbi:hypothetical protein BC567DRAFT_260411 [Phyllosticta citribraziliensis]